WIVRLASEKLATLERLVAQRARAGDRDCLEAIELTAFLATLIGVQNVERYIPLADPAAERREVLAATPPKVAPRATDRITAAAHAHDEATREMPALPPGKIGRLLLEQRAGVPLKSRTRAPQKPNRPVASSLAIGAKSAPPPPPRAGARAARVIEDAVRLLNWGREWHELADIIGALAGRPGVAASRRILRDFKRVIERRFGATVG
ncbi:MAG: hypothetical protein NZM12_10045, partial [Steroidobacteraceae bacterium]|nr:hypothetical protein [Steroidobacteraceae bacterium]